MVSAVLVVMALLLAPYVRPWLAQRSEIEAGAAELARLQREVDALQVERARWNDPKYVEAQARARLLYVRPGEESYVLLDEQRPSRRDDPRTARAAVPPPVEGDAWYERLAESFGQAGSGAP